MIKSTKTDWNRINRRIDREIDYSDIPKTDDEFWEYSNILTPQKKVDFTIVIDEDLAMWLNSLGENSMRAVNNILRAYYLVNS